jgi:5-methylcytosine-specific restriction endonuclease McrA
LRPVSKPFVRRNLSWIYEHLAASKCVDCGIDDRRVLEFDHVKTKRGGVMDMAWNGYGRASLQAEIANCEIRCANCHRRTTAARGNHFRHATAAQG